MQELLDQSITGINWISTGLLLFSILYWLIVMIGLLDVDTLDFDVDLDLDLDADVDGAADGAVSVSWLNQVLAFLNLKHIPFMVWLTFFAFTVWAATVFITYWLGIEGFLWGLLVLLPVMFVGLFTTKFLTWPLVRVFKALDEDAPKDAVGKIGFASTRLSATKKGQVRVTTDGAPVLIMARAAMEATITKGQEVLVIEYLDQENLYLVSPHEG